MTCVAAIKNPDGSIVIGADSAGTGGTSQEIRRDSKVFIKGPMIFGFTSSFRMGNLLRFKLKVPDHPHGMDTFEYMATVFIDAVRECLKSGGFANVNSNVESGGKFIVGYRGRIFKVDGDFQVGETFKEYAAVGCGEDIALGSLFTSGGKAEKRIQWALQAASEFSCAVRPPFNIMKLKKLDSI